MSIIAMKCKTDMEHLSNVFIGTQVVVNDEFLGTVTNITQQGVWVRPIVEHKPDLQWNQKQNTHSCYAPHNVKSYHSDL